jgi:hypothetical protein
MRNSRPKSAGRGDLMLEGKSGTKRGQCLLVERGVRVKSLCNDDNCFLSAVRVTPIPIWWRGRVLWQKKFNWLRIEDCICKQRKRIEYGCWTWSCRSSGVDEGSAYLLYGYWKWKLWIHEPTYWALGAIFVFYLFNLFGNDDYSISAPTRVSPPHGKRFFEL